PVTHRHRRVKGRVAHWDIEFEQVGAVLPPVEPDDPEVLCALVSRKWSAVADEREPGPEGDSNGPVVGPEPDVAKDAFPRVVERGEWNPLHRPRPDVEDFQRRAVLPLGRSHNFAGVGG